MHMGQLPAAVLVYINLRFQTGNAERLPGLPEVTIGGIGEYHNGGISGDADIDAVADQVDPGIGIPDPAQKGSKSAHCWVWTACL